MLADFTYQTYATLLDAGLSRDRSFVTVREYLDGDPPERCVVLRHDVDRKPGNALDFARIEAERGVQSTYYFRTVDGTLDPNVIRRIESLGHEIGYHYEDVDRADGNLHAAHESFEANLERLRKIVPVDTVCMHGNPLTPHDNRDMWDDGLGFEAYGLHGEAYLSMDFTDVTYYSDTGRTWRDGVLKVKDHPVGRAEKDVEVETSGELAELLRADTDGRYCILTHPDRWAGTPIEQVTEATFDTVKNVAKHVLAAVPSR